MKSLAARIFLAFAAVFALVSGFFAVLARVEGYAVSSGAYLLLAAYAGAMIFSFAALSTAAARRISKPISLLNDELDAIEPGGSRRVSTGSTEAEMRELEEHVNALLARVALTLQQLREYAAQVAHELRTPLTVLRLKIEQAAGSISPQLSEDLQSELLRLSMLTEQSLLLARAEQGAIQPNKSLVDLKVLLEDVAEDFRLMAQEQGREIDVAAASAPFMVDAKLMRQVLYSLLTNSLRHGSGRISVRLREVPTGFSLLILNSAGSGPTENLGLGLGRRVVDALVALHDDIQLRVLRRKHFYAVRLFYRSKTV